MSKRPKTKPPFRVGDKVTTDFQRGQEHIVRTVTEVIGHATCQSGWLVSANAGEPCDKCARGYDTIGRIDSDWFKATP